jgi:catechol 2,3-dioxygenase-like lactoylglutathione lyase family enzyme
MGIQRLDHCSIRTIRLAETQTFYEDIMGFHAGPRPNFPFPGVWLYQGDQAVVHVIGIDPNDKEGLAGYLGDKGADDATGTGTIDHIAFVATGVPEMRAKLERAGHKFFERTVPNLDLHQIFVDDPNGVTIELNFPAGEAAA